MRENSSSKDSYNNQKSVRITALIAGPSLALFLLLVPPPQDMTPESWRLVSLIIWMVIWWLSEAVPIPATALLPIPLMPLYGLSSTTTVTTHYAHPLVFLFLGGFLMAAAIKRWGLDKRIALKIIAIVGTSPQKIIGGFMIATALLSMWISNTATTMMMFAVALSVINFVSDSTNDEKIVKNFGIALMLSIAYSASIGGVGTLVGTPPNALLAAFLSENYGIDLDFFTWMLFGVPIVIMMIPLTWLLITQLLFPVTITKVGDISAMIRHEILSLGKMGYPEKVVGAVFLATVSFWILRIPITQITGLPINDTSIILIAVLILFVWPVSGQKRNFILDWQATADVPWGILLLYGGGLALASGFRDTGLAEWIGAAVSGFDMDLFTLLLVITVSMVFMTEITSNTASTATFLPIFGAVAVGMGLDPLWLTVPVAVAASMAFMTPVATPPNAIVFSYERMHLHDMMRTGFWLNMIAIAVILTALHLLAEPILGL